MYSMNHRLKASPLTRKAALVPALLGLVACSTSELPPSPEPKPEPLPVVAKPAPPPMRQYEPPPGMTAPQPEPVFPRMEILYLEPDAFPEAPPELRKALDELGCRIPQTADPEAPPTDEYFSQDNLVSGHFKSTAELHWAVFCSRNGETALLLFDSQGRLEDQLEDPRGDGEGGYLDYIDVADREHILEDHESFGGGDTPEPPPILLEGVESGVAGKGSSIYYWHDCQWLQLQGGD